MASSIMKRMRMHETFSVVVLFVAGSLSAMAVQEPAKTIQTVEAKPTATMNGEEMFKEYCAVCHGGDAAVRLKPSEQTATQRPVKREVFKGWICRFSSGSREPQARFSKHYALHVVS